MAGVILHENAGTVAIIPVLIETAYVWNLIDIRQAYCLYIWKLSLDDAPGGEAAAI